MLSGEMLKYLRMKYHDFCGILSGGLRGKCTYIREIKCDKMLTEPLLGKEYVCVHCTLPSTLLRVLFLKSLGENIYVNYNQLQNSF